MGLYVDFTKLKNIAKDVNSKNNYVTDTNIVLTEYMNVIANFMATLLSNIRTINPARLLNKLGTLKENISNPESLFNEIKTKMFEYYLPKIFNNHKKINNEIKVKQDEIDKLENEIIKLKEKIFDLEKQIDKNMSSTS